MGKIADRLKELNIELPASTFVAKAKSVPWRRAGNLVFLGGASPQWNGEFVFTKRLGDEIGIEEGQKAARLTAINILHRLGMACDGDLDRVRQCLMLQAYVRCTDDFNQGALVINGASELLVDVFGDAGQHARTVVGVRSLSRDITVEISSTWELHD